MQPISSQLASLHTVNTTQEIALLKICNDALMAVDKGIVTLVVLLDYSAAFDAVDHSVMPQILEKRCGLSGSTLQWHTTYLRSRTCAVVAGGMSSDTRMLPASWFQSIGLLKFVIYAAELYMNLSLDTASWSTASPTIHTSTFRRKFRMSLRPSRIW